jgi:hypothetical protein
MTNERGKIAEKTLGKYENNGPEAHLPTNARFVAYYHYKPELL